MTCGDKTHATSEGENLDNARRMDSHVIIAVLTGGAREVDATFAA